LEYEKIPEEFETRIEYFKSINKLTKRENISLRKELDYIKTENKRLVELNEYLIKNKNVINFFTIKS
jgi:hypothetical protein